MPRNGLTREWVVKAAAALLERSGLEGFSMRALADSLNVKTASLYNHVDSMEALMVAVCAYALEMQRSAETAAIQGKTGAEAIYALAHACRKFAREHRQLYHLIMNTAVSCGEQLSEVSQCLVGPFMRALEYTGLTTEEKYHWQRVLRGMIHGFISQEDARFFSHLPVDAEESFRTALRCCTDGLAQAEKRHAE